MQLAPHLVKYLPAASRSFCRRQALPNCRFGLDRCIAGACDASATGFPFRASDSARQLSGLRVRANAGSVATHQGRTTSRRNATPETDRTPHTQLRDRLIKAAPALLFVVQVPSALRTEELQWFARQRNSCYSGTEQFAPGVG